MEERCNDPYEQQLLAVYESCLKEEQVGLDEDGLRLLCDKLQLEERGKELISCLLEQTPLQKGVTFIDFRDGLLSLLGKSQEGIPNYSGKDVGDDSDQKTQSTIVKNKYNCWSKPDGQVQDETDVQHKGSNSKDQWLRKLRSKVNGSLDGTMDSSDLCITPNCLGIPSLPRQAIEQIFEKLDADRDGHISLNDFFLLFQNGRTPLEQLRWNDGIQSNVVKQNSEKDIIQMLGPHHTGFARSNTIVDMWEVAGVPDAAALLAELGFTSTDISLTELTHVLSDELKSLCDESGNSLVGTHGSLLKAALILYQEEVRILNSLLEHLSNERDKLRMDIIDANERASLLAQEIDEHHIRLEKSSQQQLKQLELRHNEEIKELTNQLTIERETNTAAMSLMNQQLLSLQQEDQRMKTQLANAMQETHNLEIENQELSDQISRLKLSNSQLQIQVQALAAEHDEVETVEARQNEQLVSYIERIRSLQSEATMLRDQNDELSSELENLKRREATVTSNREHETSPNTSMKNVLCSASEDTNHMMNTKVLMDRVDELEKLLKQSEFVNLQTHCNGSSKDGLIDTKLPELNRLLGTTVKTLKSLLEENNCACENCIFKSKISDMINGLNLNLLSQFLAEDSNVSLANELETECEERTSESLRDLVVSKYDKSKLGKRMSCSDDMIHNIDKNYNNLDMKNVTKSKVTSLRDYPPRKDDNSIGDQIRTEKDKNNIPFTSAHLCSNKTDMNNLDIVKQEQAPDSEKLKQLLEEQETKYVIEKKQLTERCVELERSLDLLRAEYEQCEDYWAGKLEEERQLFEQEQKISDEKLSELIAKMAEYEEQFGSGDKSRNDGRLSPIEERFNLEQQYIDLEEEFQKWKCQIQEDLSKKDHEIKELREKLHCDIRPATVDVCVQYSQEEPELFSNLESSSNQDLSDGFDTSELNVTNVGLPFSTQSLSKLIQPDTNSHSLTSSFKTDQENVISSQDVKLPQLMRVSSYLRNPNYQQAEAHTMSGDTSKIQKDELQRLYQKKVDINSECISLTKQKEKLIQEILTLQNIRATNCLCPQVDVREQACRIDINVLQALNSRLQTQEQKRHRLQATLKQHQLHTERILHQTWAQHRTEVADLQFVLRSTQGKLQQLIQTNKEQADQLARADLLVKDLYVENSYLTANVKRLEQHCHALTQFSAESTSV
ncbi:blastoderm-specific protein 25D isoform X2 [Orussus abietinus]|uniref:blastoderm-specific protein 25D isoform X2 n=1 Tax=Orussus abietinus TaxID=222816 RepID=UPI0006263705|nr:blastoderm-specific protein 25D isoform X2 [Orussus abietinus]